MASSRRRLPAAAGDWVLFDGHVEVVTRYSAGALRTIGGDSAPNLSVNAHTFSGSLAAQGVNGFVNNGQLLSAVSQEGGSAVVRNGSHAARSVWPSRICYNIPGARHEARTGGNGSSPAP